MLSFRAVFVCALLALAWRAQAQVTVTLGVQVTFDQAPLAGAEVVVGDQRIVTGTDGRASLAVRPDSITLTVEKAGFATVSRTVVVSDSDLEVAVERTRFLRSKKKWWSSPRPAPAGASTINRRVWKC